MRPILQTQGWATYDGPRGSKSQTCYTVQASCWPPTRDAIYAVSAISMALHNPIPDIFAPSPTWSHYAQGTVSANDFAESPLLVTSRDGKLWTLSNRHLYVLENPKPGCVQECHRKKPRPLAAHGGAFRIVCLRPSHGLCRRVEPSLGVDQSRHHL